MFKHHIKRTLAAGAVIATAGFPCAAQASFIGGGAASVPVAPTVSVSHASQTALGLTDASSGGYVSYAPQAALGPTDASSGGYDFIASAAPTVAQPGSSFDWGDAGIGAGGAVVLLATAALGASVTRRRHSAALS